MAQVLRFTVYENPWKQTEVRLWERLILVVVQLTCYAILLFFNLSHFKTINQRWIHFEPPPITALVLPLDFQHFNLIGKILCCYHNISQGARNIGYARHLLLSLLPMLSLFVIYLLATFINQQGVDPHSASGREYFSDNPKGVKNFPWSQVFLLLHGWSLCSCKLITLTLLMIAYQTNNCHLWFFFLKFWIWIF